MIASVGTPPMPNMAQMQKMHGFREGKVSLSKEDLTAIQSDMESKGITTPDDLKDIIAAYDQIDTNSDGMSFEELSGYAKENGMELKGPFGNRGPKGPPTGAAMQGQPPGGMGQMQMMQGSSNNLQLSMLTKYMASNQQANSGNFAIYA